mmetsp:Transcript_115208/g.159862  ORF Transcript_115208/g.159862 Transcript_115208/m.159862 type:complete len:161 (+) Transcript_115208:2-484(+)
MEETNFVVASVRANSFDPFSSLRCIWASSGFKNIYSAYERPPFPIQVNQPSWSDILGAMRFSDFFMGASIYGSGILWGYVVSRPMPMMMQRLVVYHGVAHMAGVVALSLMVAVPYRRLTGYWDNGMRWRRPEDKLNKYDSTSHFEAATGWSKYKIRPDSN